MIKENWAKLCTIEYGYSFNLNKIQVDKQKFYFILNKNAYVELRIEYCSEHNIRYAKKK